MEQAGGLTALALIPTTQINGKDFPGPTAIKQQRSLWKEGLLGTSLRLGGLHPPEHNPCLSSPIPARVRGVVGDGLVRV